MNNDKGEKRIQIHAVEKITIKQKQDIGSTH